VRMKKIALAAMLTLTVSAFAQFGPRNGRTNGFGGGPQTSGPTGGNCVLGGYRGSGLEDLPTPRKMDRSGFVYARVRYHPYNSWQGRTREVPWHHDYPDGDTMLPDALERLTGVHTTAESFQIVDIDSKDLFKYPFVYLSEPGYLNLLPEDEKNLREYLDRGGFLFIDDFRGNAQDNSEMENLIVQLKKLYPDRDLVPLPGSHPIFHAFFDVDPATMQPPYRMYNSGDPQFLGLSDENKRLQIMVNFNYDASEYWQTLDVGLCSIKESGAAVQLGINYVVYSMTH
jgi:hypothetical protein